MRSGLLIVCRLVLAAVFVLSVSYKALHWPAFMKTMAAVNVFAVLPSTLRAVLAGIVFASEFFLVFLLASRTRARSGAVGAFTFLGLATLALVFNFDELRMHCGCLWQLGGLIPDSALFAVVRNAVLMAVAAYVVIASLDESQPASTLGGSAVLLRVSVAFLPAALILAVVPETLAGRTVGQWVDRLAVSDRAVRLEALARLADIGSDAAPAVPDIVALLHADDQFVRQSAAVTLGEIRTGADVAIPSLRVVLGDPADGARTAAVWALAMIGPEECDRAVVQALAAGDSSRHVRAKANLFLKKLDAAVIRESERRARQQGPHGSPGVGRQLR